MNNELKKTLGLSAALSTVIGVVIPINGPIILKTKAQQFTVN